MFVFRHTRQEDRFMASGILGRPVEAFGRRRNSNDVTPAGLVGSSAESDSSRRMSVCDWRWLTSAAITARVGVDVKRSSPGSGSSRPGGGPALSPGPGRTRGRRRSSPRLRAAACARRTATKRETVTRHDLPDEMALILHTAVGDVRWASIQDLELLCRARGSSLLVVVRSAESALQRCQQDRDRHVQSLRDDDQVLDGPTGPAA
jgi:hypothetical protein